MSDIDIANSELFQKLSGVARKIDELTSALYLEDDNGAVKNAVACQDKLKALLETMRRQFLYLENRYVSMLDNASLTVYAWINGKRIKLPFVSQQAGDYICQDNFLLHYRSSNPLYFYSPPIGIKYGGALEINIKIDYAGPAPVFWLMETTRAGKKVNKSQTLKKGENQFRMNVTANKAGVVFAFRFKGWGACRIDSIRAVPAPLEIRRSFPIKPRSVNSLKVSYILDKLSETAIAPSANFRPLRKENYKIQLKEFKPDFLFVESCWEGNGVFGSFDERNWGPDKLRPILEACRELGIPTVFWNKEDPWHYEGFLRTAEMFDYIFTTDANMIPRYARDLGRRVRCLPFAAQPRLHFPGGAKNDRAFFAGTWYTDKLERCADFTLIDLKLKNAGLRYDIFDRCQSLGLARFAWPDIYRAKIQRELTPREVVEQSRLYKFQINVNTIKNSPTMFSRRVFESMAAGTPVIGNYSEGVERLFTGLTVMFGDGRDDSDLLRELLDNPDAYAEFRERGILAATREHTVDRRLEEICRVIGINAKAEAPAATMIFDAASAGEAARAESIFEKQTLKNKKLIVRLRPFDNYYEFLNKNSPHKRFITLDDPRDGESDILGLALKCDPGADYSPTFMELQAYENPGVQA